MFYWHRGSKLYTVKGKKWQLPIYSLGFEPVDLAMIEKLCTITEIFLASLLQHFLFSS